MAEKWLTINRVDKKPKTIQFYSERLKQLQSYFGPMIVDEIRPEDIEKFKLQNSKNVTATTVNLNLRVLRAVLEYGIEMGHLYENANPSARIKSLKQIRRPAQALDTDQVNRLFDGCESQDKAILMTAVMTGLRMGELLAMKWKNLDWNKGTYTVKENYSAGMIALPKTDSSYRTVVLPAGLLEILKDHKINQNKDRLKMGEKYQDNGLIWATGVGTLINPQNLRHRIYYPALKRVGLPKSVRFHDLRRTYATMLMEDSKNPKVVQDLLGHRTARVSLEIYAQVTEGGKREAVDSLNDRFFRAGKPISISLAKRPLAESTPF